MDRRYILNEVVEKRKIYNELEIPQDKINDRMKKVVKETIASVTSALVEATNSTSISHDDMAEGIFAGIQQQHAFLQGEFWIAMEKAIRKYSEMEYVDGRNAFAKDMCGAFVKGNDERTA